jgi:hypothetical protein
MIRSILKKSLNLVWRKPSLWFWGFFSTLLFLSANDLILVSIYPALFSNIYLPNEDALAKQVISSGSPFITILAILLIVCLMILAVFAEIKLILSTKKEREGSSQPSRKKKIRTVLLLRFFEFIIFLALWIPAISWFKKLDLFLSLVLLLLFLIINLFILFVTRYTLLFILLKNQPLFHSLKSALLFLKTNWLKTLKISFMLFLVILIYGLIFFSLLQGGALTYPLRIANMTLTSLGGNYGFWISLIFTILIGGLLQIIILGFIAAYQTISWAIFFLEETCEQPVPYS